MHFLDGVPVRKLRQPGISSSEPGDTTLSKYAASQKDKNERKSVHDGSVSESDRQTVSESDNDKIRIRTKGNQCMMVLCV